MSNREIDVKQEAQKVYDIEISALQMCRDSLNEDFERIVDIILNCKGNVIITGMGKSGHICQKIKATMLSLGIKAFYMHPAEAVHGDLGSVSSEDVLLIFSHSGASDEIVNIMNNINLINPIVISITGKENSPVAKYSDVNYVFPPMSEAFLGNIVPSTSTTCSLVFGDALAITIAKKRGFAEKDFALYHPSGALGKKLTYTAKVLMRKEEENAVVKSGSTLKDCIFEMCKKPLGGVSVVDENNCLVGVYTDGDLRRLLFEGAGKGNYLENIIDDMMTKNPISVTPDIMVLDAIQLMKRGKDMISILPVVDDVGVLQGTLTISDIARAGILE